MMKLFDQPARGRVLAWAIAVFAAGLVISSGPLSAGEISTMSAPEAHEKALKGEIVLIDVRRPEEWKETGVPTSAHALTMHQNGKDFLSGILNATGGNMKMPVAIICRTGNRTTTISEPLAKTGFDVINVVEGVVGGPRGIGWKKRGLPVRSWTPSDSGPQLASQ